ncbi:MAG: nickel-dependent hydrogenase large subunit [Candidatus Palauibacterales bacterium]|jgi:Ni,Fe-hydrogenase I large subunit|nr:nickel-dependent hydrogenase large subunit [Candidatus Palauibacterales bacterium]
MSATVRVKLDPITRIEGHLSVETVIEDGVVKEARAGGTLYRGFESIMQGHSPLDVIQFAQRFCGVCPTAHAIASAQALDTAFGIVPTENGRVIRNLVGGANWIQSHLLHFYTLSVLDYVPGPYAPPFIPRFEGDYRLPKALNEQLMEHYILALSMRLKAHELSAVFSGKMPHSASIVPGGVTIQPTVDRVTTFLWRLRELRNFIDNYYLPDVIAIARVYQDGFETGIGPSNLLTYGSYDLSLEPDVTKRKRLLQMGRLVDGEYRDFDPARITEEVRHSWYTDSGPTHPSEEVTVPMPGKTDAYSWVKAPRYDGEVYEVGPTARVLCTALSGESPAMTEVTNQVLSEVRVAPDVLRSTLGRHLARAIETKFVADAMQDWIMEFQLGQPVCAEFSIPDTASGVGLWCAPRGALGHWIQIEEGKVSRYQAIVPTTWNCSPRDDSGQPGPLEQALEGLAVRDPDSPIEVLRVVHSYDPCVACAIHVVDARGNERGTFRAV